MSSASVKAQNGNVFAVKTASGRYAKLQMYYTGGPSITLLWTLYQLT